MAYNTNQDILLDGVNKNTGSAIQPSETVLITGVAEFTGPFFSITALIDAEVDHSACTTNITNGADFTIPKGVTMYGNFTSISLDSGSVIAYKL